MNINATPETLRAVAQVLKMAAILDDRVAQPDKARIVGWAEQVQRHNLTEDDLLDGLQKYYDQADRPIGIGDLIIHARATKRDRLERESREEREARRRELDAKAEDAVDVPALVAGFSSGPVTPTERLRRATDGLDAAHDKRTALAALQEYFAAKAEARKPQPRKAAS